MKNPLKLKGMESLLKQAGAERVSDSAKIKLREVLEEKGVEIGKKALKFSQHSGRKTIKREDIEMALKD